MSGKHNSAGEGKGSGATFPPDHSDTDNLSSSDGASHSSPADTDDDEFEDDDDLDTEPADRGKGSTRSGKTVQELSREAGKYRTRLRQTERELAEAQTALSAAQAGSATDERAEAAEAALAQAQADLRELRIRHAFDREAAGKVISTDAAWKLADLTLPTVNDDGTIEGIPAMLLDVLADNPFLVPAEKDTADEDGLYQLPPVGTGSPVGQGRKTGHTEASAAVLVKKFPALALRQK